QPGRRGGADAWPGAAAALARRRVPRPDRARGRGRRPERRREAPRPAQGRPGRQPGEGGIMTAVTVAPAPVPSEPSLGTQARWAISDTLAITRRNLLVWMRVPAYIVFTVIQPVIFVLMFRYVFGGAISTGVKGGYVNFLMPGIIAQTAAFACFGTAI